MQEAVSQSLYSYWDALRGNRPAPKRFEIEPSRIANNLPDTFILERVNYTNARFRLAGTRITDALGMELRGRNLFEMFDIGDRRTLQNQMELIASRCAVGLFHMSAESADGKSTTFEVLILPLTHTSDTVERFLGSVASREKPEWLGSVPLTRRKLVHHEIVWPSRAAPEDESDFQYQAPILHTRREARIVRSARRQFRVFDGGLSLSGDDR
ncbi:PAS domain-containing protein [Hyphomicrobium sp. B1]|uniref:PAS domain-containing protein n=1 Tax=Hyphomicrobium sp. B1 TaxID=3075651 RepID=UPI003C2C00FD